MSWPPRRLSTTRRGRVAVHAAWRLSQLDYDLTARFRAKEAHKPVATAAPDTIAHQMTASPARRPDRRVSSTPHRKPAGTDTAVVVIVGQVGDPGDAVVRAVDGQCGVEEMGAQRAQVLLRLFLLVQVEGKEMAVPVELFQLGFDQREVGRLCARGGSRRRCTRRTGGGF